MLQVGQGNIGVGEIEVDKKFRESAQSTTFWVTQKPHIYSGNTDYTFWSKQKELKEKVLVVAVPRSRLVFTGRR